MSVTSRAREGQKRRGKQTRKKSEKSTDRMRLHFLLLFYLLALVLFFLGYFLEFVAYLVAMVLHEMAHAEAARRLGYRLTAFKLMPYGAALVGEFEGASAADETKIALAGPFCNVCLAVLFAALLGLVSETYFFAYEFVFANLFLAAVNLLPVFPLDGGRVLLALLSLKIPRQRAYKRMRIAGFVMTAVLCALFVLSFFYGLNFSLAVMAVFIFTSTLIPDKSSVYRQLYRLSYRTERLKKGGLAVCEVMVLSDVPLRTLFRLINANRYTRFRVVDSELNTLFIIEETDLERVSAADFGKAVGTIRQAFVKIRQK